MDLSEATDVLGAMIDQYATGEESEAAGIVFAELDAARAALQSQKTAADRVILEIADERDQARRERAVAHAAIAALRAKTDQHGGVPWLEPELSAVFAALDAAPAETGSGEA